MKPHTLIRPYAHMVSIICAPFGAGGPNNAAKDGPKAMLDAYLGEDLRELGFEVRIVKPPKIKSARRRNSDKAKDRIKNIDAVVKINEWLAKIVSEEIKRGSIPLTIGGDHSLAVGTISGTHDESDNFGVLWIDRHFDAHSPKNTTSWRAHGMPASVAIADKKYDLHPDFQRLLQVLHHVL